jgi:1,2-beta-oligoglucan phosphorylase
MLSAASARAPFPFRLESPSGLTFALNANGSLHRIEFGALLVNLFPGSELEGGPANLYLRRRGPPHAVTGLLGPESPACFTIDATGLDATGEWQGLRFAASLRLAAAAPAWFWHVTIENTGQDAEAVDVVYAQDVGLAPDAAVRVNEYYVSHYVDLSGWQHPRMGWVLAARQNHAAAGRFPWAMIGSLQRAVAFATDARQLYGIGVREPGIPPGLFGDLPGVRHQHEHSMAALQDAPLHLAPGARATTGFFGWLRADHPAVTTRDDLADLDRIVALAEAKAGPARLTGSHPPCRTLFAPARVLAARECSPAEIEQDFGPQRRHEERAGPALLSFFHRDGRHVVLRAKEAGVLRPHGHLLRTGTALAPDETALTSTVWMQGVFHSMLTQGHVAINRMLSTTRGYLGMFRALGQRVFVERDGAWLLLDVPSAFDMGTGDCVWTYRDAGTCIAVHAEAIAQRHEFCLRIDVREGAPARFLICHHIALDGDGGDANGPVRFDHRGPEVFVTPRPDSELGRRFPGGGLRFVAREDTTFERVGGDELLFADGRSQALPYVTLVTAPSTSIAIGLRGELVTASPDTPAPAELEAAMQMPPLPRLVAPGSMRARQLDEILPWFAHDALIHFLAPRGLEQFSGGGWGTRDVCQGPVELLLALDRPAPVRALLLRVFANQNTDGDWPQWFMFFERERAIRAGDSHGDVVFWPVLAAAQYLVATQDAAFLEERVPFFEAPGVEAGAVPTVWEHIERALQVIDARRIAGTALAAFGHGDWNDSLQPADRLLRERMSSAWTVTLHHQVLTTLAAALRTIGRAAAADVFASTAQAVARDFHQHLVPDGIVAGYALFEDDGRVTYVLHPRDTVTGVRYSLLPMIHAILNDLFSPQQAREHLALVERFLTGPDGARLFDHPLRYHGGEQKIFQRAETSAFFGREIGIMYMHAHLRYAEALAHAGDAEAFFAALCRAHPIGLRGIVPRADLRQANCYFSSSDAAFRDRYEAFDEYPRIAAGSVALDGGWRIYSSGPGIALGLVVRRLLGVRREGTALVFDPVLPHELDGLRASVAVAGREIDIVYRVRAGCGPTALRLNDAPLVFTRGDNPYRTGGAVVSLAQFMQHCAARDRSVLEIDVG